MKIAHISSEQVPFIKTGGLADVVGALSKHLALNGHEVVTFLPAYRTIVESPAFEKAQKCYSMNIPMGDHTVTGDVYKLKIDKNLHLYLISREEYFDRSKPYGPGGRDYSDNDARFIFFCKAVLETLVLENFHCDVVHCHDWQSALLPLLLRVHEAQTGIQMGACSLLTVHNLAFQGVYPESSFELTNLPEDFFDVEALEFYGQINLLKAGILFADAVTTVSPTYSREILSPEMGCGLEGVLKNRQKDLYAIINGIDTEVWNPKTDPHLSAPFDVESIDERVKSRRQLLRKVGLKADAKVPVYGIVSRMTDQKGIDFILANKAFFVENDVRLVALGSGDPRLESALKRLMEALPDKVYISQEYDEPLSHLIEAGSDFFLMPSRFEPCGLNQMYSQRYGCVPIVTRVGGLVDSVKDFQANPVDGTGIVCEPNEAALAGALKLSLELFADKEKMKQVRINGMNTDFSWNQSSLAYDKLYMKVLFGETRTHNPWGI